MILSYLELCSSIANAEVQPSPMLHRLKSRRTMLELLETIALHSVAAPMEPIWFPLSVNSRISVLFGVSCPYRISELCLWHVWHWRHQNSAFGDCQVLQAFLGQATMPTPDSRSIPRYIKSASEKAWKYIKRTGVYIPKSNTFSIRNLIW